MRGSHRGDGSFDERELDQLTQKWARQHWREQGFFRLLNRMLFWAAKTPAQRYRVLERFYLLATR